MAALIGSLQPYDPASDWKLYQLSITNFLAAQSEPQAFHSSKL